MRPLLTFTRAQTAEPMAVEAVESMFAEIGLLVLEGDAAGLAAKVSELSAARRDALPGRPGEQGKGEAAPRGDDSNQLFGRQLRQPHVIFRALHRFQRHADCEVSRNSLVRGRIGERLHK